MAEAEKRETRIPPNRLSVDDYARTVFVATVEHGTTREDLTRPDFWSPVAVKMRPWDKIEVRTDDGTFYAELLVLSCDRTWAIVKELAFVALGNKDISETKAAAVDSGYEVRFRGPHAKWTVIRKSDESVIKDGMSKDEANQYLAQYTRTIGTPVPA